MLCNKKVALGILFGAVNQTLQSFAKDPQWRLEGQLGFILVLHTWSQTLMDHFYLHCLIPGGALSFTRDKWKPANESFLFRIQSLAKEFKKRYLLLLQASYSKHELIFPGNTVQYESREAFDLLIQSAMDSICQTSLCRTGAGAGISWSVYAPHCHIKQ